MPVTVTERFESRIVALSQTSPWVETRWLVRGTEDPLEVRSALYVETPAVYDPWGGGQMFLPRASVQYRPLGPELWEATVRYETVPATGESVISFDTTGGRQHITQSKQTLRRYPSNALDMRGAIGVSGDAVEGVDIVTPVFEFAETHYRPSANMQPAYIQTLYQLTGRVNASSFRGFAAGEVLFLGATASRRGAGDWQVTYRFAASPNASGIVIGNISGIIKRGWEYLWVRYVDDDGGEGEPRGLVKVPVGVYIERLYDDADFALLDIGS